MEDFELKPRRIKFVNDYLWLPPEANGRYTLKFLKDKIYFVRLKCAEDAVRSGSAIYVVKNGHRGR